MGSLIVEEDVWVGRLDDVLETEIFAGLRRTFAPASSSGQGERAAFEPFRADPQARAVEAEHLETGAGFVAKEKQMA